MRTQARLMYVPAMYFIVIDPEPEDEGEPDDPDNYLDEAEDKETTDNECAEAQRYDHEDVPVVDASRTV